MEKRFKILIVDDEIINIQLLSAALGSLYEVITARNGYDAISQLKAHKPDLVLMDVMMPDLSGFDACGIIKSDVSFADIPVIFLTALDNREGELQGLEIGGIDYISKPVNLDLLRLRVRNHLKLKEHHDLVIEQRDLLARQKEELEAALARIRQLEGIIPICAYCKKIRNDSQEWIQLERYISEHSEAQFSHGICPGCVEEQMKIISSM